MAEEKVRLLLCKDCKSIEEIPDHDGTPREDFLLENRVSQHTYPDGNRHFGQLMVISKKHWDNAEYKTEIVKKINEKMENGGSEGLGTDFYNLKASFQDDAMTCWRKHQRTLDCGDLRSSKVRLTPGTNTERKAAGLPKYRSAKDRYLCDFCPVMNRVRADHFDKAAPKESR
ncbi:hypothetical protein GCM10010331_45560 [Streptomyces xanthochromogenes]|uniref:hypothetical protein n=1 Tax=Streptomyces xanthochromogenes TaxID=67384 RepID=UPI001678E202|nr:hypothetical protein [Streptomyces xanthochromogenes]GHB52802.1 hypothetical protein GCM10010331_45560 [Streptomyces xanthochromogenes]